jgi:hypothetical protein
MDHNESDKQSAPRGAVSPIGENVAARPNQYSYADNARKKHRPQTPPNRPNLVAVIPKYVLKWFGTISMAILKRLKQFTASEWIAVATLAVLIIYTTINYALYYTTTEILRASQRPILLLDQTRPMQPMSVNPNGHPWNDVFIYFRNTGKTVAQNPIVEAWIVFSGSNSINVPPPQWRNQETNYTVTAPGEVFNAQTGLRNDEIAKLETTPAIIAGRIRYEELSDVVFRSWWNRMFYAPTVYCDVFCQAYVPGKGFIPCGGTPNLCSNASQPLSFEVPSAEPNPEAK